MRAMAINKIVSWEGVVFKEEFANRIYTVYSVVKVVANNLLNLMDCLFNGCTIVFDLAYNRLGRRRLIPTNRPVLIKFNKLIRNLY